MSCHVVLVLFNLACFRYLLALSRALGDESSKPLAQPFLVVFVISGVD